MFTLQELTCKLINLKDDVKIDDCRVCDWVADKKQQSFGSTYPKLASINKRHTSKAVNFYC